MKDPRKYKDEITAQVDRILGDSLFKGAKRSSSFLRYVSTQVLRGESYKIKEFSIAVDAFGLETTFDQQIDPRIRVEAKRLRDRLKQYYEGPGQNDPILVAIPKGSYIPEFNFNSESETEDQIARPDPAGSLSILINRRFSGELHFFYTGGLEEDCSIRTFQSLLVHQLFQLSREETLSMSLSEMISIQQSAFPMVLDFHMIRDGKNVSMRVRIKMKSTGMLIYDTCETITEADLRTEETSLFKADQTVKIILEYFRSLK